MPKLLPTLIIGFVGLAYFIVSGPEIYAQTKTIDGAYRFVSETVTIRKPRAEKIVRKFPEWTGYFIFNNGTFSVSLQDSTRNDVWVSDFPKDYQQLGYESRAGSFRITGSALITTPEVSLHPASYHRVTDFHWELVGDTLTLTEKLYPHIENIEEGEIVTVLSRIKSIS